MQIFADIRNLIPRFYISFHWLLQFQCIAAVWNVAIQQFECSSWSKFKGGMASREAIRFL